MRIAVESFRGQVPLMTSRALPENAAQRAINARLQSGDLESWRQHLAVKEVATAGVQTIYLLKDKWLSWPAEVDVARSVIPGDQSYRVYLTGPDTYAVPQWTDYALATTGGEPFPVDTRPIGVPNPVTAPTAVVGTDPNPTSFTVDVTDDGSHFDDEVEGHRVWTVQSPSTDGPTPGYTSFSIESLTEGNPAPSYEQRGANNNFVEGVETFMHRDFGTGACTSITTDVDVYMASDVTSGFGAFNVGVQCTAAGAGLYVAAHNFDGGIFYILYGTRWSGSAQSMLKAVAWPGIVRDTWYKLRVVVTINPDDSTTVTATMRDLADEILVSVSTTGEFTLGSRVGFLSDSTHDHRTRYDNIHVTGTGATGYEPEPTSTSYVYTFRNDETQESAPSPASATITRTEGTPVTVTMPGTAPAGTEDYEITEKILYRAVTGTGGTVFKRLVVLPLSTTTYEDVLLDSQTGAVLETEDFDLPPAELQGIISLPNGMLAGFFANQLCTSVPGRPHAWRVRDRKTTDSDIVAICALDTTIVIGTKSYAYTATGTDSGSYTMSQPGEEQACVSKRSMVYLDGQGVAYASPDGWMLCRGNAGSLVNVTENVFTRRQWQALVPESIIAAVHDSVLHWFYDTEYVPPVVETPIFLDLFNGTAGANIVTAPHIPDIQLDGTVWLPSGEGSDPVLDGTGGVTRDPEVPSQASARAETDNPNGFNMNEGWRLEFEVTPILGTGQATSMTYVGGYSSDAYGSVMIRVGVVIEVTIEYGFEITAEETYDMPAEDDPVEVIVQVVDFNTVHVFINGDLQTPIVVTGAPFKFEDIFFEVGTDFEGEEPLPNATIHRIAVYNGAAP